MIWNIIGGFMAAMGPAASVAALGSQMVGAVKAADKLYDYAVERGVPEHMRDIFDSEANYYMTSLDYSDFYKNLMRLPKNDFFVAWSDEEMGEYVRLEGVVKLLQAEPGEHERLLALLEQGERRADYMSSALLSAPG